MIKSEAAGWLFFQGSVVRGRMSDQACWVLLSEVRTGRTVVIRELVGGGEFARRLVEMGISVGRSVKVVRSGGPAIIEAQGHRLVVGRGMVRRIRVEVTD